MNANADEILSGAAFARQLAADHRARVARELVVRDFSAATRVCGRGAVAAFWMGVVAGTVKIQVISPEGRGTTLATFSEGCWFGEGTILKRQAWPFDAIALRDARVALVPAATFRWLLDNSFPFNRFVIDQLNARLGQFISRCEHARLHQTDRHVAHCIAELLDPSLYPFSDQHSVQMSQEELGNLAGVSRAVVNRVLHDLSRAGVIRLSYGRISLIDPDGLRRFSQSTH